MRRYQALSALMSSFLPDVNIPCPDCRGSRYAKAAYGIRLTDRAGSSCSLPELMDMDVNSRALEFCSEMKSVSQKLKILRQLGLGYLTLGEETPGLSGRRGSETQACSEIGKVQTDSVLSLMSQALGCIRSMFRYCSASSRL